MELVLLGDIQNGYASNWARIANTDGVADIKIGDRFREQGFGQGAEELEVAGVDISPIGGASRLFFNRAANATQPEVHRLGAVLLPVGMPRAEPTQHPEQVKADTVLLTHLEIIPENFGRSKDNATAMRVPEDAQVPLKRGRGRPKGSKNVRKGEVAFPTGF
jgi:hypothetical protein